VACAIGSRRLWSGRLDLRRAPRALHRTAAQGVEQHGLADAPQAGQHHGALGAAGRDPLQGDVELPDLAVAAGELGRALAGAGGVRVAYRVHDATVWAGLADSVDFAIAPYPRVAASRDGM
jgi:hypothetical protein